MPSYPHKQGNSTSNHTKYEAQRYGYKYNLPYVYKTELRTLSILHYTQKRCQKHTFLLQTKQLEPNIYAS